MLKMMIISVQSDKMSLMWLRFIALVSVTHLGAQVLCGVQSLLVFLRGCQVYYTGLGLNVNRDNTRLTQYTKSGSDLSVEDDAGIYKIELAAVQKNARIYRIENTVVPSFILR